MSDAEICITAERIVIGEVIKPGAGPGLVLRVKETLKGSHVDELPLAPTNSLMSPVMFEEGAAGVFLLRSDQHAHGAFNPACFQPMEKVPRIREVISMYSEPTRFAAQPDAKLDLDVAWMLGHLFLGFSITSEEIPEIGGHLVRFAEPYYVRAPWDAKHLVKQTYRHVPASNPPVELIAEDPAGALSDYLAERILQRLKSDDERITHLQGFRVQLDATNPQEIAGLTYTQAVAYLHRCLNSNDVEIAMTALESLSWIRDISALPRVIELLSHESERVRVSAIQFLGYARNPEAIEPLSELLIRMSPHYPESHSQANAACSALAMFGSEAALPALEFAARHYVESSGYALGELGSAETFPILLESYLSGTQWTHSLMAGMHWLVMRSNRTQEPWMHNPTYTQEIGIQKKPLWRQWWVDNAQGFEVVRSLAEARQLATARSRAITP